TRKRTSGAHRILVKLVAVDLPQYRVGAGAGRFPYCHALRIRTAAAGTGHAADAGNRAAVAGAAAAVVDVPASPAGLRPAGPRAWQLAEQSARRFPALPHARRADQAESRA